MFQRMNELAVKASNGTNTLSDHKTIQDEVTQILTEIDHVAETTKFNETYLLKGDTDAIQKYVNAHDAGLDGKLSEGAASATFTMTALKTGNTNSIGGREYTIGDTDIEQLMGDVFSWDLCDHLCRNLIIKTKDYDSFIMEWSRTTEVYKIRAAITLIASAAIHDDKIVEDKLDEYLELIKECSSNQHEHVKKAVSWALREVGESDYTYNEKAAILANELKETGNKTQMWIAKDILKEIENVVKVGYSFRKMVTYIMP
ncbi:MAG: DNA alkylation repair protein, partial [Lachnospiraceae bacterium]|nr:DNA alkylation repair protein [Lachnospiraceae bacterium]